ncbi:MAG: rhodanese-like domain-containing protein [Lentimicrobium sp.]|jgi:rhodanese-related sulfurtransferase|nr:rhodanese-like domain-containing protein [Lentimicrobium sp.]
MKKLAFAFTVIFALAACSKQEKFSSADEMVNHALKEINLITAEELDALMNGEEIYTLIDVRQAEEHYYGYIPGSVNIPRGSIEFNVTDSTFWDGIGLYMPLPEEKIVVYDQKGKRGILAAQTLQQLGFTNVFALKEGWKKWELTYPDIYEKNLEKLNGGNHDAPKSGGGC